MELYALKLTRAELDAFTRGYIEALFFTERAPGSELREVLRSKAAVRRMEEDGSIPGDAGFSDLAPETLATILEDCRKFLSANRDAIGADVEAKAGRDFWYTRNGHGCGFWDGDWEEPYASVLTAACKAFGGAGDAYLGDDGKVYLS